MRCHFAYRSQFAPKIIKKFIIGFEQQLMEDKCQLSQKRTFKLIVELREQP